MVYKLFHKQDYQLTAFPSPCSDVIGSQSWPQKRRHMLYQHYTDLKFLTVRPAVREVSPPPRKFVVRGQERSRLTFAIELRVI